MEQELPVTAQTRQAAHVAQPVQLARAGPEAKVPLHQVQQEVLQEVPQEVSQEVQLELQAQREATSAWVPS